MKQIAVLVELHVLSLGDAVAMVTWHILASSSSSKMLIFIPSNRVVIDVQSNLTYLTGEKFPFITLFLKHHKTRVQEGKFLIRKLIHSLVNVSENDPTQTSSWKRFLDIIRFYGP